MPIRPTEPANATPPPFPEGWYFVASRRTLQEEGLVQKTWMGTSVVAWCDADGRVCVAEATCPHLGSDLGPEAGGCIRDGRLVCPFHGFEYDAGGQCVATPFAPPPRAARLQVFETQEVVGLIFAWWGIGGRAPQWSLPTDHLDQAGWSDLEIRTVRFPGHPQETTENSVDVAHLRQVHGYADVVRVEPVTVDGPRLESRFDFRTTVKLAGLVDATFDISTVTHVWGPGYSLVDYREHSIGMDVRLWVLATPIDGTLIDLSLVTQVREIRDPRRRIVGLGFLPPRLRAPIMNKFVSAQEHRFVLQDVAIWSRKQYRARPRLCRSDGEIMLYRRYCAQFYPDPGEADGPGA